MFSRSRQRFAKNRFKQVNKHKIESKQMALMIHNVKGDGHCFYRCLWRIIRSDTAASEIIYLIDKTDEDAGMQEIRDFVAIAVRRDYTLDDFIT